MNSLTHRQPEPSLQLCSDRLRFTYCFLVTATRFTNRDFFSFAVFDAPIFRNHCRINRALPISKSTVILSARQLGIQTSTAKLIECSDPSQ